MIQEEDWTIPVDSAASMSLAGSVASMSLAGSVALTILAGSAALTILVDSAVLRGRWQPSNGNQAM